MTTDTQSPPAKASEKLTKRQTPAKINRLDHKQMYKLNRWYESVHGDLPRGATREEVAREATKDLGFTVTVFNLDSTIEATGLALPAALPDAPLYEVVRALAVLMRDQLKAGPEVPLHEIDEHLDVLNAYLAKR